MLSIVIIAIVIALVFDFLNGMNDAANSIATIVSTKVLPPLLAVIWAAFFNFAAVFFFGVHVATTIGKGIVDPLIINEFIILAALIGAVIWVLHLYSYGAAHQCISCADRRIDRAVFAGWREKRSHYVQGSLR